MIPPQALVKVDLAVGKHDKPTQGMCVMEMASLLAKEKFSDHPTCVNEVITRSAQRVNDSVSEADRQRLKKLLPRIMRCRRTGDDKRINVRLAIYCARSVEHLVHGRNKRKAREAIEAAEKWLRGEATEQECASDASAAYASATHDRVLWLSDLIDAWEKAAVEEGEALWEPQDWENDLIAFAEALDA